MATSGSINYSQTRNQIVTNALTILGVQGAEDTVSSSDMAFGSNMLDLLIKAWQNQNIGLWCQTEATVFLIPGTTSYKLGGSSPAKASNTVVETTLSASAAIAATSLTVTTVSGMTIGDVIGIVLDDNTTQWTTITNIVSTTLTINTGLTSAATSGNRIYTYTTVLPRPLNVTSVRYRDANDKDRELQKMMWKDYAAISDKTSQSIPSAWVFVEQLNNSYIHLYKAPSVATGRLKITYTRTLEDLDGASDNPDLPQQWLLALTYNLAMMLAPPYGRSSELSTIGQMAQQFFQEAKGNDIEEGSLYFIPEVRE